MRVPFLENSPVHSAQKAGILVHGCSDFLCFLLSLLCLLLGTAVCLYALTVLRFALHCTRHTADTLFSQASPAFPACHSRPSTVWIQRAFLPLFLVLICACLNFRPNCVPRYLSLWFLFMLFFYWNFKLFLIFICQTPSSTQMPPLVMSSLGTGVPSCEPPLLHSGHL